MRLKRIKLKNIRSYEEQEINFPDGSILLSGDIGSGKTSILLAVEYALFGLQPGQRGASLLSNGKDNGEVVLDFEIDGRNVSVERGLKRNSASINQDYAAITIDGERIESSVTEIKTRILELLNYPPEFIKKTNLLYRYTVYTPQELMKQIILEDSESRLNILRHIFGIEKYKRIKENLSVITLKLREKSKLLQVEIRDLDESKNNLQSSIKFVELLAEKIESKSKDICKLKEERKKVEEDINEIEQRVKEKDNFSKEIEKTKIMLVNKVERLSSEDHSIKEIEKNLENFKDNFDENEIKDLETSIKHKEIGIEELNNNYISISSRINSINLLKQEDLERKNRIFKIDICPVCLQNVSDNHKHNILNAAETTIKRLEREEKDLAEQLGEIIKLLNREKSEMSELKKRKSSMEILKIRTDELAYQKEKLNMLNKSKESLVKDIEFLEKHIDSLKQSTLEFTKYDNIMRIKQDELKKAFVNEKNAEIELAELKKEAELTEKEIVQIENKVNKIERTREQLIRIIEIERWLSNDFLNLVNFTENNILLTLRNEFSKLFNKWFSMLTTDSFHVRLDENFTPIINQGEFEIDYSFLSGGERTAVALAYRLALNQILNSMLSKIKTQDLVILDEPTDGFSDQQLDKVRDILQELNVKQLILVSHEQKIEGFVENVIKLKKEASSSRIQENHIEKVNQVHK